MSSASRWRYATIRAPSPAILPPGGSVDPPPRPRRRRTAAAGCGPQRSSSGGTSNPRGARACERAMRRSSSSARAPAGSRSRCHRASRPGRRRRRPRVARSTGSNGTSPSSPAEASAGGTRSRERWTGTTRRDSSTPKAAAGGIWCGSDLVYSEAGAAALARCLDALLGETGTGTKSRHPGTGTGTDVGRQPGGGDR